MKRAIAAKQHCLGLLREINIFDVNVCGDGLEERVRQIWRSEPFISQQCVVRVASVRASIFVCADNGRKRSLRKPFECGPSRTLDWARKNLSKQMKPSFAVRLERGIECGNGRKGEQIGKAAESGGASSGPVGR
jgi:hypothetical protein